jgi:hypothetical protein
LLLLGGTVFVYQVSQVMDCLASQSWPATPGKVTESGTATATQRTSRGRTMVSHSSVVHYTYQVAGQDYTGTAVEFGDQQRFQSAAEAVGARYPAGKAVTVYYDPASPGRAVLERALTFSTYVWLVLSLAFAYAGTRLFFIGVTRQARAAAARRAPWARGIILSDYVVGPPGLVALLLFFLLSLGL